MEKPKLPLHEWLAVLTLLLSLVLLIGVTTCGRSQYGPESTGEPHYIVSREIEVAIEGAVESPGTYFLKRGALVKDLLELSKPLPEADLRKINPESKLRDGRVIKMPFMPMITINLEGAVKHPGELRVRKGTRLMDLAEMPLFSPEADLGPLNKKRRLKEGERVVVSER